MKGKKERTNSLLYRLTYGTKSKHKNNHSHDQDIDIYESNSLTNSMISEKSKDSSNLSDSSDSRQLC